MNTDMSFDVVIVEVKNLASEASTDGASVDELHHLDLKISTSSLVRRFIFGLARVEIGAAVKHGKTIDNVAKLFRMLA